jgi:transcriptional regulator with XRE-family HTH domain
MKKLAQSRKSTNSKASSELLGAFLKAKREKANLTQKDIADRLGYSTPQFISSWERGEREPPMNVIWQISSIYRISAEKLFDVMLAYRQKMLEQDLRAEFLACKPKSPKYR